MESWRENVEGKMKDPEFHKIFWNAFTGLFNFHIAM